MCDIANPLNVVMTANKTILVSSQTQIFKVAHVGMTASSPVNRGQYYEYLHNLRE